MKTNTCTRCGIKKSKANGVKCIVAGVVANQHGWWKA